MWDFVFRLGMLIGICLGIVGIAESSRCREWKRSRAAKRVLLASGLDYRAERRRDCMRYWKN